MADLTTEQHDSIRAAVRQILMPLIEGVLIQKLAQVAVVIRDELERNAGVQPAEPLSSELATAARRFLTRWQEMSECIDIETAMCDSELHRAADALEATLGVQEPRAVTPQEDAVLRRAAMRSAKVVSAGVPSLDALKARRQRIRATLYSGNIPDDLPRDIDRRFEMVDELDRQIAAAGVQPEPTPGVDLPDGGQQS